MVRRLLAVGIDQYKTPSNNLNSCVNDARAVEALLRERYDFTEVRTLHDQEATLDSLREQLNWLVRDVSADDRLVYYQSSHGARLTVEGILQEVLVMHDETFLHDDELSDRTQALPAGVLTCLLDTCHSGGLDKLVVFDDGGIELVRGKVWMPPPAAAATKAFSEPLRRVKQFGAAPTGDPAAVRKAFAEDGQAKGPDEQGQTEMNGLLAAAALAEETALAATSRTSGLSVFTFYLLESLREGGIEQPARSLVADTERRIRASSYRQTPVVKAPSRTPDLVDRVFVTFASATAAPHPAGGSTGGPGGGSGTGAGTGSGGGSVATRPLDPVAAAIDILRGRGKAMSTPTTTDPAPAPAPTTEDQEKFFGALIGAVVPALVQHLPGAIAAITGRRKGVDAALDGFDEDAQEKFLGPLLQTLLPVASTVIPTVLQALGNRPKDTDGMVTVPEEEIEEKFLGPLLQATVPILVSRLPDIVRVFTGQAAPASKALARDPEVSEKFLGSLLSSVVPALVQAVPDVVRMLGGRIASTKSFATPQPAEPVLTSKGWFQLQPFPWDQLVGSSRILQDGDELRLDQVELPGGGTEVVLAQAAHKTWWKGVGLEDSSGAQIDFVDVEGGRKVSRAMVLDPQALDFARLVLWKAKLFGAHTAMYVTSNLRGLAGKRTTINWLAD